MSLADFQREGPHLGSCVCSAPAPVTSRSRGRMAARSSHLLLLPSQAGTRPLESLKSQVVMSPAPHTAAPAPADGKMGTAMSWEGFRRVGRYWGRTSLSTNYGISSLTRMLCEVLGLQIPKRCLQGSSPQALRSGPWSEPQAQGPHCNHKHPHFVQGSSQR